MPAAILRPLTLGEILDTSFQVYRRHFADLILVMLICYGPWAVAQVFMAASGGALRHPFLVLGFALTINVVLGAIATAATVFIISAGYLGRPLTGREALTRSLPFLGRLVLTSFAVVLLVGLGSLLFLVPGIILACGFAVTWPALVLESQQSANAALRRSWELTKGSRGRIFLLVVALSIIAMVPVVAVSGLLGMIGAFVGATGGAFRVVQTVITAVLVGLVQLMSYCVLTVLYYDLRVRREGFDLELLATTLQTA